MIIIGLSSSAILPPTPGTAGDIMKVGRSEKQKTDDCHPQLRAAPPTNLPEAGVEDVSPVIEEQEVEERMVKHQAR